MIQYEMRGTKGGATSVLLSWGPDDDVKTIQARLRKLAKDLGDDKRRAARRGAVEPDAMK